MAISLGGGGSASQVNETIDINSAENLITLEDGRVYLKGGVTSTDLTTYPDATAELAYSGVSFSLSGQTTGSRGITWDGSHFFVVDQAANKVFKYTSAGVYTGTQYALSIGANPCGITWDGTYFWVVTVNNNAAYKYNASFVYQNVSFSLTSQGGLPIGIVWDDPYFWIVKSDKVVYKYNASFVYQNVSFNPTPQEANPTSIAWDGTHLWVIGFTNDTAFQYTTAGVYTGTSISAASQETNPRGLTFAGSDLWVTGLTANSAFKYAPQIGVTTSQNAPDRGHQNYIRIK